MAVLAITNNLLYHVESMSDIESLGSNNGITTDTVAWVEGMSTWCWPTSISASTSTWACGDLTGTRAWSFQTNDTTDYAGGFYDFGATPNTFSPALNFGTANVARAAHFFIVTGAVPSAPVTIRCTGTSITDEGVRTTGDTEDITVAAATSVSSYFETDKKWNGQVTISVVSGTPFSCNYGWSKYHDVGNSDFVVTGFECLWESDSTDSTSDIELLHHKATGWTYNASGPPIRPTAIAARSTDYSTENDQQVGEGAWKRVNLSLVVNGAGNEGILWEVTSGSTGTGSLSFRLLNIEMSLRIS